MAEPAVNLNIQANSAMLAESLEDFESWRETIIATIISYAAWLDNQSVEEAKTRDLHTLIHALRDDKLVVAMVGEYSRGKTELINAMFFSEYQCRLLPSTPGRTTMCPTEILSDPGSAPSIRLLPIETRLYDKTVVEFKQTPDVWVSRPLNVDSIEEMTGTLQELVNNKKVPEDRARELGFVAEDGINIADANGEVEIPTWRHAQINYPHPLLQQGLVILDTPGLNALGSEPELTLRMLPNANAVIFVLAADTGVTQSDLNIWKNHVCVATKSSNRSRLAVLNKIDTLWDELLTPKQVQKNIDKQIDETSKLLGLERSNVFPVSAVKGLVSRIQNNNDLLERSGLLEIERKLSTDLVSSKREIIRETISSELGQRVETSQEILASRIEEQIGHAQNLLSLDGKSEEIVDSLVNRLRDQKRHFETEVESFVATRSHLDEHVHELLSMLSPKRFESLFADAKIDMHKSMTTIGLRKIMTHLFDDVEKTMKRAEVQSERIRGLLDQSYRRFHKEFKMSRITPARFNIKRHNQKLSALLEEANEFRDSSSTIVNKQAVVIDRFFDTFVDRIRSIIGSIDQSARNWAANVLNPIRDQLKEHKRLINQRLEDLESLQKNRHNLKAQLKSAEVEIQSLTESSKALNEIMLTLKREVGYKNERSATTS